MLATVIVWPSVTLRSCGENEKSTIVRSAPPPPPSSVGDPPSPPFAGGVSSSPPHDAASNVSANKAASTAIHRRCIRPSLSCRFTGTRAPGRRYYGRPRRPVSHSRDGRNYTSARGGREDPVA